MVAKEKGTVRARRAAALRLDDPMRRESDETVGNKFFTRHGRVTVVSVEGDKATVTLADGSIKQVSTSSLRRKAVTEGARSRYPVDADVKTASGKPSIGVADEITEALKGAIPAELGAIFQENLLDPKDYKHLNPGMQRMTLGNLLRGLARNGKTVKVHGKKIVG